MDNYKDLEETNEEIERSKVIFHGSENQADKKDAEPKKESEAENTVKEDGSGIFTADGKELPEIDGGYDIIDPGGSLGDDDFVTI